MAVAVETGHMPLSSIHDAPRVDSMAPSQHSSGDFLACHWTDCHEVCPSAELLYEHVCERHIGRKSTNNLQLTCEWGTCRTTTVKRDHITSHMRVHVPLKPHKCDFCGKQFKRPQDLKKHVKTHADDSILRTPDVHGHHPGIQSGFADSKSFYPGPDLNGAYSSSTQHHDTPTGAYAAYPQAYSRYGQVNYPASAVPDQQSVDTRRRAIEALNDFLGDVKRRTLDPNTYYDVCQRLNAHSLPLPVSTGSGYSLGSGNNTSSFSQLLDGFAGQSYVGHGSANAQTPLTQTYSLPINHARTKPDLIGIDRFLEQLQATVSENSGQAAAAGVQQPGVHAHMTNGYNVGRASHSPPQSYASSVDMSTMSQPLSTVAQMASMSGSSQVDTPALTPASISSYASSSHSPVSSHSRSSLDGMSMYPQLPSVAGMSDMCSGYASAPHSGLVSGFDSFDGRKYSGGRLQREAPASRHDAMDVDSDRQRTPRKLSFSSQATETKADIKMEDASKSEDSPAVDPTLEPEEQSKSSPAPSDTPSTSPEDKAQEAWVENVRVIEKLRAWIRSRLEQGDFERDEDSTPEPPEKRSAAKSSAAAEAEAVAEKVMHAEQQQQDKKAQASEEAHAQKQNQGSDDGQHQCYDQATKQEFDDEQTMDDAPVAYPTLKAEE